MGKSAGPHKAKALATNPYQSRLELAKRIGIDGSRTQNPRQSKVKPEAEDLDDFHNEESTTFDPEATDAVLRVAQEELLESVKELPRPFEGEDLGRDNKKAVGEGQCEESKVDVDVKCDIAAAVDAACLRNQHSGLLTAEQKAFDAVFNSTEPIEIPKPTNSKILRQNNAENRKVLAVYQRLGRMLQEYRAGKPPKPLSMLPTLANWERLLKAAKPELWTSHAVFEATRLFSYTTCSQKESERFLLTILYPRIRKELDIKKKLHPLLYRALFQATYRAGPFFRGIVFPLLESRSCKAVEAAVVSSVVKKVRIPVLHAAAAILLIAEMKYTPANSVFLKVLIDKGYALPYKTIDALVTHFYRYKNVKKRPGPYSTMGDAMRADHSDSDSEMEDLPPSSGTKKPSTAMPPCWHESLLVFAEKYRNDIVPEQKEVLLRVVHKQFHHIISPRVMKLISTSGTRDVVMDGVD